MVAPAERLHVLFIGDPSLSSSAYTGRRWSFIVCHSSYPSVHFPYLALHLGHSNQKLLLTTIGAANRFPDKCDANPAQARSLNIEATRTLSTAASSRSIFLIYISTDYVFAGKPGEAPYDASAPTNPPNFYGETKRDGENVILEGGGDGVVLRVPVLYGEAGSNAESAVNTLVDTVWKAQDPGAKIKMDDWAKRYPTNTEDVGRVCHDIAVKYLSAASARSSFPKILQFTSEDCMTKYQMCEMFAEILGLPLEGMERNQEGNDPNAAVQRPYDTHMSTEGLKGLGINVVTQDFKGWWLVFLSS